jgi:hypothetical protein
MRWPSGCEVAGEDGAAGAPWWDSVLSGAVLIGFALVYLGWCWDILASLRF